MHQIIQFNIENTIMCGFYGKETEIKCNINQLKVDSIAFSLPNKSDFPPSFKNYDTF